MFRNRKIGVDVISPSMTHSTVIETVDMGMIDERKVLLVITNGFDISIEICAAPRERDVFRFSVDQWHALERRVLEGLQAVAP